jgi:hypothetical protein
LQRPHVPFTERYCPRQRVTRRHRARSGGVARRRRSAHNIRLDHDIAWPTNHQQVLDIVAAHKNETAPAIDGGLIDDCQPRLSSASSGISQSLTAEPAQEPQREREDAKNNNEEEQ